MDESRTNKETKVRNDMKWINAEQRVTVSIYDDEHEEYLDKIMTVEEMLDTYTNEGCPTIYSNPEQTSWIPVSERLPEESGDYLVTTKWKGRYSGNVYVETNMAEYRRKTKEWDCVDVIAWMPLPQPYTESEEEE